MIHRGGVADVLGADSLSEGLDTAGEMAGDYWDIATDWWNGTHEAEGWDMLSPEQRAELIVETLGHSGLGWEAEGFSTEEVQAVRAWLSGKAASIYGGSFEIQNNIIAKNILGLPENTQRG